MHLPLIAILGTLLPIVILGATLVMIIDKHPVMETAGALGEKACLRPGVAVTDS